MLKSKGILVLVVALGLCCGLALASSNALAGGTHYWVTQLDDDGTPVVNAVYECTSLYPAITWAAQMEIEYDNDMFAATSSGNGTDAYVHLDATADQNFVDSVFQTNGSCAEPGASDVDYFNFTTDKYLTISF